MSGLTRQLNETEQAFSAVVKVGIEQADMIEQAQIAGDIAAESLAQIFGMAALQEAIAENPKATEIIGRAAGHSWGFNTDRNKPNGEGSTYPKDVVIPCFCEALLKKLKPVGNEFNIIQSSTYITKEGWIGKVERLPGVTEVDIAPGVIRPEDCTELKFMTKAGTRSDGSTWGGVEKTEFSVYASARASCFVWGKYVEVTAGSGKSGFDDRLQVAADGENMSDVIDQLRGKAVARIAHMLHMKCKGLSMAGPRHETQEHMATITHSKPRYIETERVTGHQATITHETVKQKPNAAMEVRQHRSLDELEADRVETINQFTDGTQAEAWQSLWQAFANVKNVTALKAAAEDAKGAKELYGESAAALLGDWYLFRLAQLKGEVR